MSELYETHPIYHVNPKVRFKIFEGKPPKF